MIIEADVHVEEFEKNWKKGIGNKPVGPADSWVVLCANIKNKDLTPCARLMPDFPMPPPNVVL
jgi:hypothetical protein